MRNERKEAFGALDLGGMIGAIEGTILVSHTALKDNPDFDLDTVHGLPP